VYSSAATGFGADGPAAASVEPKPVVAAFVALRPAVAVFAEPRLAVVAFVGPRLAAAAAAAETVAVFVEQNSAVPWGFVEYYRRVLVDADAFVRVAGSTFEVPVDVFRFAVVGKDEHGSRWSLLAGLRDSIAVVESRVHLIVLSWSVQTFVVYWLDCQQKMSVLVEVSALCFGAVAAELSLGLANCFEYQPSTVAAAGLAEFSFGLACWLDCQRASIVEAG